MTSSFGHFLRALATSPTDRAYEQEIAYLNKRIEELKDEIVWQDALIESLRIALQPGDSHE